MLPETYVAPKVEQVVTEEELSREMLYAGIILIPPGSGNPTVPVLPA